MPKVDLTGAIFSFSKLKTYETCPYSWYDIYVNKVERIHNAFSQYGTLVHEILEKYAMGRIGQGDSLETWELLSLLEESYDKSITERFPKNNYCDLAVRYKENAVAFFENIDNCDLIAGIENGRFKILGVEHKFIFDIEVDGEVYQYTGFVDLVIKDITDDSIIIVDHKSKSIKTNTKGAPVEKDIRDAYLQMSTYATAIKNDFGQFPKEIWIDAFKIQSIFKKEFTPQMAEDSILWCKDMIRKIKAEYIFAKKPESFFCTQLCSCRNTCGRFIIFDKSNFVFNGQPASQADRIALEKATIKQAFMEDVVESDVVKPFSWDDEDEEFDM